MTEFKIGQRVKVELEGTIVGLESHDGCIKIWSDQEYAHYVCVDRWSGGQIDTGAKVTLTGPENWPPQVGDIWEADGGEFVARKSLAGRDYIVCIPVDDIHGHYAMETAPFKALNPVLVRRRGQ